MLANLPTDLSKMPKEFMISFLIRFNDTLMGAALEMEQNVEKLMPKN